jgi:hypothetical protein
MFSMAVAGLAKSLIAVTITLNPRRPTTVLAATPSGRARPCRRSRPAPTAARPTGPPSGGPTAARYPTRT